jgi:hypothetical protein
MEQFQHRVIDGRVYRVVQIEAADTREASRHVSSKRPCSAYAQRVGRREAKRRRP